MGVERDSKTSRLTHVYGDAGPLDLIDYYRRCLEDIQDGRPVRDLAEAKAGYDRAFEYLRTFDFRKLARP